MKNYTQIIKSVAAFALGASVITSAAVAVDTTASAKTTHKVLKGKLVNSKNKKVIAGFKVYNSVLYKNGKTFTGIYKGKYYKEGQLYTGVVSKTFYQKGVAATKVFKGVYYKKGKCFTGTVGKYYFKSGKKFKGSKEGKYYVNGVPATGVYEVNGVNVQYKNGKVVTDKVAPLIKLKDAKQTFVIKNTGTVTYKVRTGDVFTLPIVTAKDNLDKSVKLVTSITDSQGNTVDKIDTSIAGIYTIIYTAKDLASNQTTVKVTVNVEDVTSVEPAQTADQVEISETAK
ncbi:MULTISPECIES: DUF5011 domain-containing protein [Rummeliibacillus]|uniref:DUF5011 domain-containing protein n=1 Tax=Rummeliibacillus TaxID=648802 RepID=UPI0011B3D6EA|nr:MULTISPECIES: DUF5011 domain-containing protein [Rummeliibacillus]